MYRTPSRQTGCKSREIGPCPGRGPPFCIMDGVIMLKKGIRLAALALTMALFICSWNGTLAAGEPVDGLYTVGVTSNSNMFRVVKCVLRVEDGRLAATLTLSGKGYGYLLSLIHI